MFNNAAPPKSDIEEGSITEVDPVRRVYKVRTLSGQNLQGVMCVQPSGGATRSGDRVNGVLGDRVIVSTGLGYPIITGFLPKLQNSGNVFPLAIDKGENLIDTGNFSEAGKNTVGDQNAPRDMVGGDRIINSSGGGLIGLLRGGSLLLRSSRLSEIFLCKFDDLVRIASRNWQHFTDVGSDVVHNIKGRIYRYTGYSKEFKDARVEDYKFHQYSGDVVLGEFSKTNMSPGDNLPAPTDVIHKEQITIGSGGSSSEVLYREIHLDGTHDLVIKDPSNKKIFTRIKNTNGEVVVTYSDTNIIKVNLNEISHSKGGDHNLIIQDDAGIRIVFNDAVVNLHSEGIDATFSGHYVKVHSGGVSFG